MIAAGYWLVKMFTRLVGQLARFDRTSPLDSNGETGDTPGHAENLFDPHAVLGVSTDAPPESVKAAYRELIKRNHPDLVASMDLAILEFATERTKQIHRAFEMIGGK